MVNVVNIIKSVNAKLPTTASNPFPTSRYDLALSAKVLRSLNLPSVTLVTGYTSLPRDFENQKGKFYLVGKELYWCNGSDWVKIQMKCNSKRWGWGSNTSGWFGINNTINKSVPTLLEDAGYYHWDSVSSGVSHTFCVDSTGNASCAGLGSNGQLGTNTYSTYSRITFPYNAVDWVQIDASKFDAHTGGVRSDGTLWMTGLGTQGQIGNGLTSASNAYFVNTSGAGTNWLQVSCGNGFTAATKTDGTLWTWGTSAKGALGDGTTSSRLSPVTTAGGGSSWVAVSCGQNFTAATKFDGTLWTWGANYYGQLGDNSTTSKSSPSTTIGGGTTWSQVSCGYSFMGAIKMDGTLWMWGINTNGVLGDNTVVSKLSPVTTAGGGINWKKVSCGGNTYFTAAIKTDGSLWTWGTNSSYQLGTGNTTSRSSPGTILFSGTQKWKDVSSGASYVIALESQDY